MCACLDGAVSECASVRVCACPATTGDETSDETSDDDETVIDMTDQTNCWEGVTGPLAPSPTWQPDRANKPPSFQLGVKPVCMLNKDLHHCQ